LKKILSILPKLGLKLPKLNKLNKFNAILINMPPGWGEVGIQSDIILQVYENRLQRTLKRQTNSGNEAH